MATKKYLELKEFSAEELQNELARSEGAFSKLKFDHSVKGLDNPLSLRELRRDIARLKAESRRREIEAMSSEDLQGRSKIRARRRSKK